MWSYGVARLRLPVCATTVDRKQTGCFGLLVFEICTNKQYENSEREHIHMYIHTEYGTIRKKTRPAARGQVQGYSRTLRPDPIDSMWRGQAAGQRKYFN